MSGFTRRRNRSYEFDQQEKNQEICSKSSKFFSISVHVRASGQGDVKSSGLAQAGGDRLTCGTQRRKQAAADADERCKGNGLA